MEDEIKSGQDRQDTICGNIYVKSQPGRRAMPKLSIHTLDHNHNRWPLLLNMWAAQFRHPSPSFRTRALPLSPLHPLQATLPSITWDTIEQNIHTECDVPGVPLPSLDSFRSSSFDLDEFDDQEPVSQTASDDPGPIVSSQWDDLLHYYSKGRSAGRHTCDYLPFTSIAPKYLPSDIRTPTWILEQIRGDFPSDQIKLGLGSPISLQDITLRDTFYAPSAPTMLGVIDRMQWWEEGYQVATVSMHLYLPNGYDIEREFVCFVAIPIWYIDPDFHLPTIVHNSLGQTSMGDDKVCPPCRRIEIAGSHLGRFQLECLITEDRSVAVRNWVDEQSELGWF
jgi:hypothetical protein